MQYARHSPSAECSLEIRQHYPLEYMITPSTLIQRVCSSADSTRLSRTFPLPGLPNTSILSPFSCLTPSYSSEWAWSTAERNLLSIDSIVSVMVRRGGVVEMCRNGEWGGHGRVRGLRRGMRREEDARAEGRGMRRDMATTLVGRGESNPARVWSVDRCAERALLQGVII
jgi:hypothetical protein